MTGLISSRLACQVGARHRQLTLILRTGLEGMPLWFLSDSSMTPTSTDNAFNNALALQVGGAHRTDGYTVTIERILSATTTIGKQYAERAPIPESDSDWPLHG